MADHPPPLLMKCTPTHAPLALHEAGERGTLEWTLSATTADDAAVPVSFWHDVPLFPGSTSRQRHEVHMVCEVPKNTRAKNEIQTEVEGNPIKQDKKGGKPRYYFHPMPWNYGALPRTWEDPGKVDVHTGCGGDNDPLDVVEIGMRVGTVGEVSRVRVLGALCLIDSSETDWKLVVIRVDDPWAAHLFDIGDVERLLPGTLGDIREWFRSYKVPDGKPPCAFGLEERFKDADFAMDVVDETHRSWRSIRPPTPCTHQRVRLLRCESDASSVDWSDLQEQEQHPSARRHRRVGSYGASTSAASSMSSIDFDAALKHAGTAASFRGRIAPSPLGSMYNVFGRSHPPAPLEDFSDVVDGIVVEGELMEELSPCPHPDADLPPACG